MVGDLVFCKEHNIEKVKGTASADCKDEDSNAIFGSHDIDEVSGAELPEERNNPVRVCHFVLAFCLFSLLVLLIKPSSWAGSTLPTSPLLHNFVGLPQIIINCCSGGY